MQRFTWDRKAYTCHREKVDSGLDKVVGIDERVLFLRWKTGGLWQIGGVKVKAE